MSTDFLVFDDRPATEAVQGGQTSVLVLDPQPSIVATQNDSTDFIVLLATATPGAPGPAGMGLPTFVHGGLLEILSGTGKIYNDTGRMVTISALRVSVEIPATGSSIVVDWKIDGVVFATLTLGVGLDTAVVTTSVTWSPGSYLSVDITQVGSTYAGDSLTTSATAR
jgi:hypothetical protein